MGLRFTEVKIKQDDGTFSEPYPVGAKAENVDMSTGETVEEAISELKKIKCTVSGTVLEITTK